MVFKLNCKRSLTFLMEVLHTTTQIFARDGGAGELSETQQLGRIVLAITTQPHASTLHRLTHFACSCTLTSLSFSKFDEESSISIFRCSCPPHVHGLICETSFTPCEKNPCGNDQLCISVSGGGSR